eukprot:11980523-Ditylum_brightwellii.AAC.1
MKMCTPCCVVVVPVQQFLVSGVDADDLGMSLHLIQLLDVPAVVTMLKLRYIPHNVMDYLFHVMPSVGHAYDYYRAVPAGESEGMAAMLDVPDGTLGADDMIAIDFLVEFPSGKVLFVVEGVLFDSVGFVGFVIPHHGGWSPVGLHWFGLLLEHAYVVCVVVFEPN